MRTFLRPLPFAIAGMAILLSVKVTGLVQVVSIATPARASASRGAAAAAPKEPPTQPTAARLSAGGTASGVPPEPPVSEAERAVLQELRARRAQLDSKSQSIDAREATLAAAERRLNERLTQLSALQAKLEQLEKGRRERDEANWRGLVKTYETMRPRDAAVIFNELDEQVLLQVLDRMKEAKAAPILAAMMPERARAATARLAELRSRTSAGPVVSGSGSGGKR